MPQVAKKIYSREKRLITVIGSTHTTRYAVLRCTVLEVLKNSCFSLIPSSLPPPANSHSHWQSIFFYSYFWLEFLSIFPQQKMINSIIHVSPFIYCCVWYGGISPAVRCFITMYVIDREVVLYFWCILIVIALSFF